MLKVSASYYPPATDVVDESTIAKRLRLRTAPGHTPGQISLDLISSEQGPLFCGDVLHHLPTPQRHLRQSLRVRASCHAGMARPVSGHSGV